MRRALLVRVLIRAFLERIVCINFCIMPLIDDAWIDLHNPDSSKLCYTYGSLCSEVGIVFTNAEKSATVDPKWLFEVKLDDPSKECLKFKDPENGGKVEDEDCEQEKPAGCYIHCRKK